MIVFFKLVVFSVFHHVLLVLVIAASHVLNRLGCMISNACITGYDILQLQYEISAGLQHLIFYFVRYKELNSVLLEFYSFLYHISQHLHS